MKQIAVFIFLALGTSFVQGELVTWSWSEPVTRADGSALLSGEIDGYGLKYSGWPFSYEVIFDRIFLEGTTTFSLDIPPGETASFQLRTVDVDGRVSEWTQPVVVTVPELPAPPIMTCQ